jgi:TorS N-terminal sensor domain
MTATDVVPSALPSTEDRNNRPEVASAGHTLRFGVAFRLLIAFAAITAFAAATSAIALYTFNKYGESFNRIASSSLPALVAASDLAQRSQALAANAPNLAVADGHFARRAVSEALGRQLKEIAGTGAQVRALAPATEGLDSLSRNEAALKDNLEKLDGLVAERLEADRVAANFMLRLRTLPSGFGWPTPICCPDSAAIKTTARKPTHWARGPRPWMSRSLFCCRRRAPTPRLD